MNRYMVAWIALFALLCATELRAQYARGAFDLKRTSELYDERGYRDGKTISVDGNLMVSNSNGNVSYTYPISSFNSRGYTFDVNLNYCGSVAFTSYVAYDESVHPPDLANSADVNYPIYGGWRKFHQNRPAWILGVNGFAVQVISATTQFHCNPLLADIEKNKDIGFDFDDGDLVWTIDGYDASNRMADFEAIGAPSHPLYTDAIRLLRDDGSVLELFNNQPPDGEAPHNRPELYSGYYYVNSANNTGFAYVELDSTDWPAHVEQFLSGDYEFMPRKVHYFPGDGLEYVFREWTAPYGMGAYLNNHGELEANRFGGPTAGPTVFYLQEIRCASGQAIQFQYSRHNPGYGTVGGQTFSFADSTLGRALLTGFTGHTISYGPNYVSIEALGRTTLLKIGRVNGGGAASGASSIPFRQIGYIGWRSQELATYPDAGATDYASQYSSWLGMVTEIIDPEGRSTRFDYERYRRIYRDFGFPRTASGSNRVSVRLDNWRLSGISEPSARYRIGYESPATHRVGSSGDSCVLVGDTGEEQTFDAYALNNVAGRIYKYDPCDRLLRTDLYTFTWPHRDSTFVTSSTHVATDAITGVWRTNHYAFSRHLLDNYMYWMPRAWRTTLDTIEEIAAGDTSITTTSTERLGPYLYEPALRRTVVNGILKTVSEFYYDTTTVNAFGGTDSLMRKYGRAVGTRREYVSCPCASCALRDSNARAALTVTEYLHLPQVIASDTAIRERVWDKIATIARWRASHTDLQWEKAMFDPRYAVYRDVVDTFELMVPSHHNLVRRTVHYNEDGVITGGIINAYYAGAYPLDSAYLRGRVLSDSLVGSGERHRLRYSYEYGPAEANDEGLLIRRTNANGATVRYAYDFYRPSLLDPEDSAYGPIARIRYDDDSEGRTRIDGGSFDSYRFGRPAIEERLVRRFPAQDPQRGAVVTDTLRRYYGRTFFGLADGQIDANGWYSRFDYDRNGRLLTAWLPYDFRADTTQAPSFEGVQTVTMRGYTIDTVQRSTVDCPGGHYSGERSLQDTVIVDPVGLEASVAVQGAPKCPCDKADGTEKGRASGTLDYCRDTSLAYVPRSERTGHVVIVAGERHPLRLAERLDSARLELVVLSYEGSCLTLDANVAIGGTVQMRRTFTNLNCPTDHSGTGDDGVGGRTVPGGGGTNGILTGGSGGIPTICLPVSTTPVSRVARFDIDLTTIRNQLLAAAAAGTPIDISLKMQTVGGSVAFANDAEDTRPRLVLKGRFRRVDDHADYTIAFVHDDDSLSTTVRSKIDDYRHTSNLFDNSIMQGALRRYTQSVHRAGADGLVARSEIRTLDHTLHGRIDSLVTTYSGFDEPLTKKDQEGNVTATTWDAQGRVAEVTYPDGSHRTTTYRVGRPLEDFGIGDQELCGFACREVTVDENGIATARYRDAFDRIRREVVDTAGMRLTTTFDYDMTGRLLRTVDPSGNATTYEYDPFGNVSARTHPDFGRASFAYDPVGNLRFSESRQQDADSLMTFYEYDDLDRLTLVGEASFGPGDPHAGTAGIAIRPGATTSDGGGPDIRFTDLADPTRINLASSRGMLDSSRALLTANASLLWDSELYAFGGTIPAPGLWTDPTWKLDSSDCVPLPNPAFADADLPVGPVLRTTARVWQPRTNPTATLSDFENIARYPQFARMVIRYDTMPRTLGPVWSAFPVRAVWDSLAPHGSVRNQRDRESAIAYREHGGQPYHFMTLSYDERGRLEALLRYTDNLGFDAVYYRYNSLNQVRSVRVSDPFRSYTTWYGYDANGRVDSVWSRLSPVGGGLGVASPHYPTVIDRPRETADMVFSYTPQGDLARAAYPQAQALIDYSYTARRWIDSIRAVSNDQTGQRLLFQEIVAYDPGGRVQRTTRDRADRVTLKGKDIDRTVHRVDTFDYDAANRMDRWNDGAQTTSYTFDRVGNRTSAASTDGSRTDNTYGDGGPDRAASTGVVDPVGSGGLVVYAHDGDGARLQRQWFDPTVPTPATEQYRWSYRKLLWQYRRIDPFLPGPEEWRYRYNPQGERESRRQVVSPTAHVDPMASMPRVYYLLGATGEQLAVYHGTDDTLACGVPGRTVRMYPVEYNTIDGGLARITVRPDPAIASGRKEFRVTDHQGSTRIVFDEHGTVLGAHDYRPFGTAVTGLPPRQGFVGREQDVESGLGDFGARRYDPLLGRFLSVDPMWQKHPSLTPYHYAMNSPVTYSDPTGLDSAERARALETARKYVDKKGSSHYKLGAKGGPGHNVDCSGLVSNCIRAAGLEDPVGQGRGTGVQQLEQGSEPTRLDQLEPGNIVTFRTGGWGFHVGIIESVHRGKNGHVRSFTMIHSSSSANGPARTLVTPGGRRYLDRRIHGYWKWDSPDQASTPAREPHPSSGSAVPSVVR